MIWYAWIQSFAMFKQQDVRWCVFADRFRYQFTMFVIRILIGLSRLLHAHIAYEIYTAKIFAALLRISYFLHDLIRLNSIVCHVQTQRCIDDAVFDDRFRYQWTMFVTPSCSYCIWNRWWQNDRSILPNFLLFAWFDKVEFNRLPCSKSKMYDDAVFDDLLPYQVMHVWSVYIDRVISTPWYWYCIWKSYVKRHHW